VPEGVIPHDDRQGNELVTDPEHLMVVNAGSNFWHAEEMLAEDPPLRMLQIFVWPNSLNLESGIQQKPLPIQSPASTTRRLARISRSGSTFRVSSTTTRIGTRSSSSANVPGQPG
jgi:redox-sensitive bicupin YhaK (pirin superfamily)